MGVLLTAVPEGGAYETGIVRKSAGGDDAWGGGGMQLARERLERAEDAEAFGVGGKIVVVGGGQQKGGEWAGGVAAGNDSGAGGVWRSEPGAGVAYGVQRWPGRRGGGRGGLARVGETRHRENRGGSCLRRHASRRGCGGRGDADE
ncbi:hypothetical protein FGB62_130g135 [Gracilaria domingensis]|nr:hypothetical protein FGB62_130g135 [Gracilaria domingensis]